MSEKKMFKTDEGEWEFIDLKGGVSKNLPIFGLDSFYLEKTTYTGNYLKQEITIAATAANKISTILKELKSMEGFNRIITPTYTPGPEEHVTVFNRIIVLTSCPNLYEGDYNYQEDNPSLEEMEAECKRAFAVEKEPSQESTKKQIIQAYCNAINICGELRGKYDSATFYLRQHNVTGFNNGSYIPTTSILEEALTKKSDEPITDIENPGTVI